MNTASAGTAVHEGTKRPGDHDGARRGSIPDNHHYSHQYHQGGHQSGSLTTPAPSPLGRPSSASSADYPPQPPSSSITPDHHQQPSSYQQQRYSNGHPTSASSPDHHYNNKDQHYPSQPYPSQQPAPPSSQLTPSPPLPSPADGFQGRPLPPIEPSHPLHSYMSNSRRGSVTDPADYHTSAPDVHKRSSISAMDSSSFYNSNGNSNTNGSSGPGGPGGQESRLYANSSPSSVTSSNSEPHYPPYPHPSTSPMQLRQSEHISGRRESLPSIHSSAGPLGQLLAQEPQRRHSIAHGDQMMGPLKRKTSSTPLSQMHSSSELEHPAKRRDSIPDAAHPLHHHHHPYPPRSSFSAPSSPPRRGSNAMMHGPVPTLNLQPAAEIKSSMMPSSSASALHNGPGGPSVMDHVRPHFPLHQPRRPSLLSDASLSRRSSVADNHHYPSHYQPSSSSSHNQEYDHNMDMDMERMHLHGPPDHPQQPPAPLGPGGQPGSHLYPGYPAGYPGGENGHKGDTPYSRSPELRVSHKLAERKRRKEMKELFDELRDALPVDRSLKTSKWEILSKAVDYISGMRENQDAMSKEIDMLRQEVARLKNL
ncbi:hypothetical protein BGZ90_007088 [Linnemannia elongata]|nr:hypothetical protein BGZ90_007088 [Linnemannia elongata]